VRALVQYWRFYAVQKWGVIGIALTWIKVAVLACVRDRREYGSYVEHVATLHLLYVCIGVPHVDGRAWNKTNLAPMTLTWGVNLFASVLMAVLILGLLKLERWRSLARSLSGP
jgi:hypothetical protein